MKLNASNGLCPLVERPTLTLPFVRYTPKVDEITLGATMALVIKT
jgi:hypothetical protein